ncbi:MAG: hypothetical protein AAGF46_08790 [Pseudomonadota bacterium]
MKPGLAVLALATLVCSAVLLVLGGAVLEHPLLGVPLGQPVSALFMLAGPFAATMSTPPGRLRQICMGILALALFWLPVGTLLAGNMELNFVDRPLRSSAYWHVTWCLAVISVLASLFALVRMVFFRAK